MKNFIHILMLGIVVPAIWLYLQLIRFCSKVIIIGEEKVEDLSSKQQSHLFVFWHNQQFILPLLRTNRAVYSLVSDSRDGDYMTALCKLFGKPAIRGSSSRNGMAAMKEMMRLLRAGKAVAVATDGPRGPAFKVKPGVVQMAQALQVPIIAVSFAASRKKVMNSWDSSWIIKPFGRIAIVYSEPQIIAPDCNVDDACLRLEQVLHDAASEAANHLS